MDLANRVQKFVDCRSKDVSRARALHRGGRLGAWAPVKTRPGRRSSRPSSRCAARSSTASRPITTSIFKIDIITDLIKVLGCGVELHGKSKQGSVQPFDVDNLRWNKIVICTDADVDGYQIRTLILTMLYRLDAYPDRRGIRLYCRVPAVRDRTAKGQDLLCLHRAGEGQVS